jgi:sugar lactone lactonase YvrE
VVAVERLTEPVDAVGESPVWRAAERALYWTDITARRIHRLDPASGRRDSWPLPEMAGCFAFDARGGLIAGMQTGIYRLALEPGGGVIAEKLAAPEMPLPSMRFNDGRCDRQGRFWAGTMHMDMPAAHAVGALYRYDARGLSGPHEPGLFTQNGLAWSPEGDRMYLSDSHPRARTVWVFDYDRDAGLPRNRRVFVDMKGWTGRPDGAAVDADGCYWSCANDGGEVVRFTPAGAVDRRIALPVRKPSMCAFGGEDYATLFVTSIRPQAAEERAAQPLAGAVFALLPGVRGLPEPGFAGRGPQTG